MAQPVVSVPKVPSQEETRPSTPTPKPLATRKPGKAVVPHRQTDRQRQVGHPLIPTYPEVHLGDFTISLTTLFFSPFLSPQFVPLFVSQTLTFCFHTKEKRCSHYPPPLPRLAQVYIGPLSHCEGFEPTSDSTLEPLPPNKLPPLCHSRQVQHGPQGVTGTWVCQMRGCVPHLDCTHSSVSTCAGSSSGKGQSRSTGAQ